MANKKSSFFRRNGLSLVLVGLLLASWFGQVLTGQHEFNERQTEHGAATVNVGRYLLSGHFVQATFENWESEFFQMTVYVWLTIFLRQQGSSESKSLEEEEEVDREPQPGPDAPWPVQRGGLWLLLYKNSLSLVLLLLFVVSFWLHALGSHRDYNLEQELKQQPVISFAEYLGSSRLWFESFQNWQSEFLAVATIVVLSIFLRQKGSPQSKPVDAPDEQTGSS